MKKLPITLAACLVLTASCNENGKKPMAEQTSDTTEVKAATAAEETMTTETPKEEPFATELLTIEKVGPENMNVHFKFNVDYPVQGPDALVKAAKQAIVGAFGKYCKSDDSKKGLEAIGQEFVDQSVAEIKEFDEETDGKYTVGYGYDGVIRLYENTPKYVTYMVESYLYTGGAHGMPQKYYMTLDKKTGKNLGWDDIILKDQHAALAPVVQRGIESQYYEGQEHHWDEVFKFVLPEQPPTMTTSGLLFNYSAYEIDCYAAGMPYCTIPYEEVRKFMTPEALKYIP